MLCHTDPHNSTRLDSTHKKGKNWTAPSGVTSNFAPPLLQENYSVPLLPNNIGVSRTFYGAQEPRRLHEIEMPKSLREEGYREGNTSPADYGVWRSVVSRKLPQRGPGHSTLCTCENTFDYRPTYYLFYRNCRSSEHSFYRQLTLKYSSAT